MKIVSYTQGPVPRRRGRLVVHPAKYAAPSAKRTALRQKIYGGVILVLLLALFLWLTALLGRPILHFAADPSAARAFFLSRGAGGVAEFLSLEVLQGFLPIPLELSAVAAGYVYGRLPGFVLTLASVVLSTALIYSVTRLFGHRLVDFFFTPARQQKAGILRRGEVRDLVTALVFFIPGMPKRLFVFTAGLLPPAGKGGFLRFLVISTLARVPALLACSFGGEALGTGKTGQAVILFAATVGLAVLGFFVYRKSGKKRSS